MLKTALLVDTKIALAKSLSRRLRSLDSTQSSNTSYPSISVTPKLIFGKTNFNVEQKIKYLRKLIYVDQF